MNLKKEIILMALLTSIIFGGCSQQSANSNNNTYDNSYNNYQETTYTEEKYEYLCAVDLIGEPILDIEASGFDFDMIRNLTEYNLDTAKPYTVLVDGTGVSASAVICKKDAIIAEGI